MICITSDPKTVEHIRDANDIEIIYHDLQQYDSLYDRITVLGLELERLLIDRLLVWTDTPCNSVVLIWEKLDSNFLDVYRYTKDFRGDEVLVKDSNSVNWIAGNPRAIIKWAASVSKLIDVLPQRTIYPRTDNTRKFIWWAMRLNLKLYILPK